MLWAITSFFNPAGYKNRLINYRLFRSHLRVPLVAVELSFSGKFELRESDAEILVQIRGGDVMWQKERLLNVALRSLPSECDMVAWLDCDVIFSSNDWSERTREALKTSAIVQLYSERRNLARGGLGDSSGESLVDFTVPAVACKYLSGTLLPEDLNRPGSQIERRSTTGLAWAASRGLLEKNGLYDARIFGSGDKAILCAAIGRFEYAEEALSMNSRQREHYRAWGNPLFADTGGRVGYIEGLIWHLWHGDPGDRRYESRHLALKQFDYDPYSDIALGRNRVWRWNSNKPEMHEFVVRYFQTRREDGRADVVAE